jgi:hypothetical protein
VGVNVMGFSVGADRGETVLLENPFLHRAEEAR